MTSVLSISRLLMRACAPVSFIAVLLGVADRVCRESGYEKPLAQARGGKRTDASRRRALRNYEDRVRDEKACRCHEQIILLDASGSCKRVGSAPRVHVVVTPGSAPAASSASASNAAASSRRRARRPNGRKASALNAAMPDVRELTRRSIGEIARHPAGPELCVEREQRLDLEVRVEPLEHPRLRRLGG